MEQLSIYLVDFRLVHSRSFLWQACLSSERSKCRIAIYLHYLGHFLNVIHCSGCLSSAPQKDPTNNSMTTTLTTFYIYSYSNCWNHRNEMEGPVFLFIFGFNILFVTEGFLLSCQTPQFVKHLRLVFVVNNHSLLKNTNISRIKWFWASWYEFLVIGKFEPKLLSGTQSRQEDILQVYQWSSARRIED